MGVCMCVSLSTKSPADSYLCVSLCVCYRSTPGRAVNARTIRVCVRAHVRLRVGMSSVYVCLSGIITLPSTATCVPMCVYVC